MLVNRFRIFRGAIHATPENVEHYLRAAIVLHNLLIREDSHFYANQQLVDHFAQDGQLIDGGWRHEEQGSCFNNLAPVGGNHTTEATQVRDTLAIYFSHDGQVPWQRRMVNYDGFRREIVDSDDQPSDDPDLA